MYRIAKTLRTEEGREIFQLIRPGFNDRFWAKSFPMELDRGETEALYRLLQTLNTHWLPAPVAWGSELVEDREKEAFTIYPWIAGDRLNETWNRADGDTRNRLLADILRALDLLHFRGLVHGDLKPENILVGENHQISLIDLDWSYPSHEAMVRRSGTLEWIAPEVLEGSPPDGRSDLYSLGLILYRLTTPHPSPPFSIQDRLSTDCSMNVLKNDPPWREWLERCCRRNPIHRWKSAFESYRALPGPPQEAFYQLPMVHSRYRLPNASDKPMMDSLLHLTKLVPTHNGYLNSVMGKWEEDQLRNRWELITQHPSFVDRLNADKPITESFFERLDKQDHDSDNGGSIQQEDSLSNPIEPTAQHYREGRYVEALELGEQRLRQPIATPQESARLKNILGLSLTALERFEEALVYFTQARTLYLDQGDLLGEAKTLNNLGMIYHRQGNYPLAQQRYHEGLEVARRSGQTKSIAGFYGNLAALSQQRLQTQKALSYLEEAQQLFEEINEPEKVAYCVHNRVGLMGVCGRFDEAIETLDRALRSLELVKSAQQLLRLQKVETLLDAHRHSEIQDESPLEPLFDPSELEHLPPPQREMAHRVRFRLAILNLLSFDPQRLPENSDSWLGIGADELENARHRFWLALYYYLHDQPVKAASALESIEEAQLSNDILTAIRLTLLRHQISEHHQEETGPLNHRAKLENLLNSWSDQVPIEFQRYWWRHPLFLEIQRVLRKKSDLSNNDRYQDSHEETVRILQTISRLTDAPNAQDLLQWSLEALVEIGHAERGFIVLQRSQREEVVAAVNFKKEAIDYPQFEVSHSLLRKAMKDGKTVQSVDAQQEIGLGTSVFDLNIVSVLILPLIYRGEVLGAAYLDHRYRQGVFEHISIDLMRIVASQIAGALHAQELRAQLEDQSKELSEANRRMSVSLDKQNRKSHRLERRLRTAQQNLSDRFDEHALIGQSPALRKVLDQIRRVTDSPLPVILTGESGTGKELAARALHYQSERGSKPFVAINCGAFPESLIEAELFGYEKGAFTGADRRYEGAFQQAHEGTLLLDEIDSLALAQQVKLLRVLQEREVRPLGANRPIAIDVRIVSATNADLMQRIDDKQFREDLYYRLNGITLVMPPLRERIEDLPLLIEHFQQEWSSHSEKKAAFTGVLLKRWMSYPWPGNIRQLQNLLHRYFLFGEDPLEDFEVVPSDLNSEGHAPWLERYAPMDGRENGYQEAVRAFERDMIREAMKKAGGKKTEAARLLGLRRQYLRHYRKKLDMD